MCRGKSLNRNEFLTHELLHSPLSHFPQCTLFPPTPPPPQILHNLCFLFLLAVPREIENNAYAKFWGANKVHYGKCGSDVL